MTRRLRLPNRRRSTTIDLDFAGLRFHVMIGFDQIDRPREIFIRAAKPDTLLDRMVDDAAVIASVALQHGADPEALAKSVAANSPIGAALALLKDARP